MVFLLIPVLLGALLIFFFLNIRKKSLMLSICCICGMGCLLFLLLCVTSILYWPFLESGYCDESGDSSKCTHPTSYRSGRDTHRAFGNGRFQIVWQSGRKVLVDNDAAFGNNIVDNVIDWNRKGTVLYVISNNLPRFHRVDYVSGAHQTYLRLEDVPAGERKYFQSCWERMRDGF